MHFFADRGDSPHPLPHKLPLYLNVMSAETFSLHNLSLSSSLTQNNSNDSKEKIQEWKFNPLTNDDGDAAVAPELDSEVYSDIVLPDDVFKNDSKLDALQSSVPSSKLTHSHSLLFELVTTLTRKLQLYVPWNEKSNSPVLARRRRRNYLGMPKVVLNLLRELRDVYQLADSDDPELSKDETLTNLLFDLRIWLIRLKDFILDEIAHIWIYFADEGDILDEEMHRCEEEGTNCVRYTDDLCNSLAILKEFYTLEAKEGWFDILISLRNFSYIFQPIPHFPGLLETYHRKNFASASNLACNTRRNCYGNNFILKQQLWIVLKNIPETMEKEFIRIGTIY